MRKFLAWLQNCMKNWIKPAPPALISGLLSDLTHSRSDLVVENALLRQQLIVLNRQVKRPQLTNPDRFHLVLLAHFTKFGTIDSHDSARYPTALASGVVSLLLAAEVARPFQDFPRNDRPDPKDGCRELLVGSRADPGRIAETWDGSE